MKQTVSLLLLCAMLVTLLAGCASAPEPVSAPAEAEAPVVRLGALTGPTAMGMVNMLGAADRGETHNRYEVTLAASGDMLLPNLLQGELDIAAVPVNLASVLCNKTQGGFRMLAVGVLGVLYIGETGEPTVSSVADLYEQTIYASGKGAMPEAYLRYLLRENGLDPDADVEMEWKSEPAEVVAAVSSSEHAVCLLPQPYAAAAKVRLGDSFSLSLSLSEAWDDLHSDSRCVTACVVVRSEFAGEHPDAVEAFLQDYAASVSAVNGDPAAAGVLCEQYGVFPDAAVAEAAIPLCSLVCLTGADMRAAAEGCLQVLLDSDPSLVGGALPGDDFYYGT